MHAGDTLETLFRHHRWANLRIVDGCLPLSDAQLDQGLLGTYGTIRDTLRHMMLAERSYLSRIRSGERYTHPEGAPPPSLEEMRASLDETGAGLIAWAARVEAGDAGRCPRPSCSRRRSTMPRSTGPRSWPS